MALVDLWRSEETQTRKLFQLITFAGSGSLSDGNITSAEFRSLLQIVSVDVLQRFADECLNEPFDGSGFALQDIMNEAGQRLGYNVKPGFYRGRVNAANQDALWLAPDGWGLIVEVKTTSAYQIRLATIAAYRERLIASGELSEDRSSILIVVGREKTDDFEAQIRGSRFAWTVRMISVQALLRLLAVGIDDEATLGKIHRIFVPQEYTKVDGIIDLVFETAEAARESIIEDRSYEMSDASAERSQQTDETTGATVSVRLDRLEPISHDVKLQCLQRVQETLGIRLIPKSRSIFMTADASTTVMCAISKRFPVERYWFAFHDHQRVALDRPGTNYVVFGCGSAANVLCIPYEWFKKQIPLLNSSKGERPYHHVHIDHIGSEWHLRLRGRDNTAIVSQFLLPTV